MPFGISVLQKRLTKLMDNFDIVICATGAAIVASGAAFNGVASGNFCKMPNALVKCKINCLKKQQHFFFRFCTLLKTCYSFSLGQLRKLITNY